MQGHVSHVPSIEHAPLDWMPLSARLTHVPCCHHTHRLCGQGRHPLGSAMLSAFAYIAAARRVPQPSHLGHEVAVLPGSRCPPLRPHNLCLCHAALLAPVDRELTPSDGHPVLSLSWSPTGDAFLVVLSSAQPRIYDRWATTGRTPWLHCSLILDILEPGPSPRLSGAVAVKDDGRTASRFEPVQVSSMAACGAGHSRSGWVWCDTP